MQVVTLITDFGSKGFRSAALKGALVSVNPETLIIDVSHEITAFDIDEAAFILRASHASFPAGAIHIVNVFNYYGLENRIIFFKHLDQYFIGPDNGIFSLVFESLDTNVFTCDNKNSPQHYTADYASIVSGISLNKPLDDIGVQVNEMNRKLILQPVIAKDEIRGSVIFVDRFGNIIVNIKEELFNQVKKDRPFSLFFNRYDHIHTVSDHYMQVDIGSPLCSFNPQGFLEVAVNLQRADELLGIKKGDVIQIKFEN